MMIFVGVSWERASNECTVVRSGNFFSNFGRHTFKVKANIITRRYEVPYCLSSDLKCLTLNDLVTPFYAKICFHRRLD